MKDETLKRLCAKWWADRLEVVEKRGEFKKALLPKIMLDDMLLQVDYDPNRVLLETLREIGIECFGRMFSARGILPFKTRMVIENGNVRVSDGYGQPYVNLQESLGLINQT